MGKYFILKYYSLRNQHWTQIENSKLGHAHWKNEIEWKLNKLKEAGESKIDNREVANLC